MSPLKKKSRVGLDLTKEKLLTNRPAIILRRQYYSQFEALFYSAGFLSPTLLRGKALLRHTLEGECKELLWDSPLPKSLYGDIVQFVKSLYELEEI